MAVKPEGSAWIADAEFAALCSYVELLASRLNLLDWDISVERTALHPDEKQDAAVTFDGDYKDASLSFSADWGKFSAEKKRAVLVHELLHLHTRSLWMRVEIVCKQVAGKPNEDLIYDLLNHDYERSTDCIAKAVAPLLPPYPHAILKNRSRKSKTRASV